MAHYNMKQGETGKRLIGLLMKADGTARDDLSGATVNFMMWSGTTTKVDGVGALVTDGTDGKVYYDFISADTDTPGVYKGQFNITLSGGAVLKFPDENYINIVIDSDNS